MGNMWFFCTQKQKGEIILDLNERGKKKLTVEDILKKFEYAV